MSGHALQAWEILNNELFAGTRNNQFFFEPAQNPTRGFFGQAGHVGQVLMDQSDANTDAIRLLNAGTLREVDENRGHSLFGPVQGKRFGIVLGFAEAQAEVVDDIDCRFRISLDHVQHGLSMDFDDRPLSHGLGASRMVFPGKGRGFTAKQISGHENLEGNFTPLG